MELVDEVDAETQGVGTPDAETRREDKATGEFVINEAREDLRLHEESIAVVRGLILKAHPELVEELIVGGTLSELMESVAAAQAAYRRVAEVVRGEVAVAVASAPVVPAGGARSGIVIEELGADQMIKRGLADSRRR